MSIYIARSSLLKNQPHGIAEVDKKSKLLGSEKSILIGGNTYSDIGSNSLITTNSATQTIGRHGKEFYGTVGAQVSTPNKVDYSYPISLAGIFNGYLNSQANSIYFFGQRWQGGVGASGADWPHSLVMVLFPSNVTTLITEYKPAWLEIEVSDNGKLTWFTDVKIVPGLIA